ncbi:unnamed protein product [Litomosoides sigmodontis]|uniref:Transmembrane protein 164 n=1 Tax=Litomosoides sigmodontis TaxID=42156 RepID=A0A3P6TIU0_LITSI|nr:unnamed protein product [Litomosoides sigmodontis]
MNVIWDRALGGINYSIPEVGGPQCVEFLPLWQRIAETLILVPLGIYGIIISSRNLEPLDFSTSAKVLSSTKKGSALFSSDKNLVRYSIIALYCFIFGSEIIYKLTRRVAIFILNPCHIATIVQILLLTSEVRSRKMCFLFRVHMYLLPGALIAIAFPTVNSRVLPGEVLVYFAQHAAILAVPFFIVYVNGTFLLESFQGSSWSTLSFSVVLLYHFTILQLLGLITEANLGCVICPVTVDPFYGRFYRLATVIHQGMLIPLIAKFFNISIKYFIRAINSDVPY